MNDKVYKLYENCRQHMQNTPEDWDEAAAAFNKLYPKLDEQGKSDCLVAYDKLAKEIELGG